MPNINLTIHGHKAAPGKRAFQSESPDDDRYGFWGMVTELHPENHTIHVRTPEGRVIPNVGVSSSVWVTIDKDKGFLSGRRYMPPIDTYVLVFMPNGHYSSAVVIASGFSDDPQHEKFKGDPEDKKDIDDKNEIDEFVKNSGWKYTEDNRTGTRVLQNKPKEETIKLEIDQEAGGDEKIILTIHGNIFTVDKENGVTIQTDKNIKKEVEGDSTVSIAGNSGTSIDGDKELNVGGKMDMVADGPISFKNSKSDLLEIGNAVATMGKMISDFLQAAAGFKSVGSPAAHTAPDFSATAGQIKAQWDMVFK